ncbi:MAG: Arylsulfatase [Planctomycetes bacterium ADurb.Bin126]|nr:MAG: Arylsulfatase [Planctomycetes bacterium ADurb.Bin126]HOD81655.1 sulfatase-like hydrolase/transferase [Phycisphaerae bacterium]HQL74786.1 sulfatase-like hydrolase/transferase [Phycisphaerae bacterium]
MDSHKITRRSFLKSSTAVVAASATLPSPARSADRPARRPNVIVILTDDQGYGDLSCYGHPFLKTPHTDRLHDQGVRLADFHVAPVCTPTRSQLMTGLDCLRNRACCVPGGRNILRRDVPTMAELFRDGGYRTGLFGKWHLGDCWPDRPMDRGFDRAVWFRGWGLQSDLEFDNDYEKTRYLDQMEVKQTRKYCTDHWFDEAIIWMDACRREGKPFFCYLPTNAPHGPLWARKEDEDKYADAVASAQAKGKKAKGGRGGGAAAFFGMIANIDDNLGKLESFLEGSGLRDDTIIVFFNDNGGTAGVRFYNAGMRTGKGQVYEGGHRAACFVRWPGGNVSGGRDVTPPTHVQDLLPTFADLCGLRAPDGATFDGTSLAGPLRASGAKIADRMLVVQYGGRLHPVKHDACVIWGKWRLVKGKELYDIEADRAQSTDLSARQGEVVKKMLDHYERWWAQVAAMQARYLPAHIGSANENPVILTCNLWQGVDVDNCHRVAAADGGPVGGPWNVHVERAGTYQIELRRWPFHADCTLSSTGPAKTVAGRPLTPGKAVPIAQAVLKAGGREQAAPARDADKGVTFRVDLPAGPGQVHGWFRDAAGKDLCGAFYAKFKWIG